MEELGCCLVGILSQVMCWWYLGDSLVVYIHVAAVLGTAATATAAAVAAVALCGLLKICYCVC